MKALLLGNGDLSIRKDHLFHLLPEHLFDLAADGGLVLLQSPVEGSDLDRISVQLPSGTDTASYQYGRGNDAGDVGQLPQEPSVDHPLPIFVAQDHLIETGHQYARRQIGARICRDALG